MSKILVVDDDEDIVYMVKAIMEKNGHEVTTAPDGYEALKVIKNDPPDLMIVDLTMPEMDGWRLSMKVRQDKRCKDIPIIVLSGLLIDEESQPEPNDPYDLLIAKPFDILKLATKVKELLEKKSK
jgi:CheY-like chemotaxis protein